MRVTDLIVGTAAEHLVCAQLLMAGYQAFRTDQICGYDVVVAAANKLLRIQVKATRQPNKVPQRVGSYSAYMWHVRRAGKGGRRNYSEGEFDLLALVALDTFQVAYLPPVSHRQTMFIYAGANPRKNSFEKFTFATALKKLEEEVEPDVFDTLERLG